MRSDLGIMFTCDRAPEELVGFARRAEETGFGTLWLVEDRGWSGGIASAVAALSATSTIHVGLGVMPAAFRHPMAAAMEVATIARLFPGRFIAGIGHGVPSWMQGLGLWPRKPVGFLGDTALAVRALVSGEPATVASDDLAFTADSLVHPAHEVPVLALGVRSEQSLAMSGRVADATILAEWSPPEYLAWARTHIDRGRGAAGRGDRHGLIVFASARVDDDRDVARAFVRTELAERIRDRSVDVHLAGLEAEPLPRAQLDAVRTASSLEAAADSLADDLIDRLTAVGSPDDVRRSVAALHAAGATQVVLRPVGSDHDAQLTRLADALGC